MKPPQRPAQRPADVPPPTGTAWIAGIVLVAVVGGGLWLRHLLHSPPPAEVTALPTHPRPEFPRRQQVQHHQPDSGFDSDDAPDVERAPEPVARDNTAPGKSARGEQEAGAAGSAKRDSGQQASQTPVKHVASNGATLSARLDGSSPGTDDTTPIVAEGLEVDADAGATRFPFGAQLAYPDRGGIDPSQGTLAFWARLEGQADPQFAGRVLAQLQGQTGNSLQINMGARFIGMVLTNANGEQTVSYAEMSWVPGVWHHIATAWGEAVMQLYIDGNLADQKAYAGELDLPPDSLLYIGSQRADPNIAAPPGYPIVSLRALNVFPQILEPDQVSALMVQTAPPA